MAQRGGCILAALGLFWEYLSGIGISRGFLWDILEICWDHFETGALNPMGGVMWLLHSRCPGVILRISLG